MQAVYCNHDDEPAALQRDAQVRGRLADAGVALHTAKDHVVFERSELLTAAGRPFSVFTPYKQAWLKKADNFFLKAYPVAHHASALAPVPAGLAAPVPVLAEIGFEATNLHALKLPSGSAGALELLDDFLAERIGRYHESRDFPGVKGPSYLSTHLRFGTLSIRHAAREAWQRSHAARPRGAATWLSELIWRLYHQILHHHPHRGRPCSGLNTSASAEHGKHADALLRPGRGTHGYPLVDAAMAQINQTATCTTGCMVPASWSRTRIDWRRGEAWFAEKLNDFDLAANNGGWQWSASTGCDAQPWFRIFNPVTQSQKFDPTGRFIRRYLPQLAALPDKWVHAPWLARPADLAAAGIELGRDYPSPIVQHDEARRRTLERYAVVKSRT